ncbi:MAG: hypothetical protein DI613_09870 [Kocuria rhizophila]|uniref:hypothetical protein n=1 Tax=Kocuria carniphila TaxID=262208 RepID=UPI000DB242B1|nr:MAG: hypothetical protein DI613_09870 [Kocuria rhizophila]
MTETTIETSTDRAIPKGELRGFFTRATQGHHDGEYTRFVSVTLTLRQLRARNPWPDCVTLSIQYTQAGMEARFTCWGLTRDDFLEVLEEYGLIIEGEARLSQIDLDRNPDSPHEDYRIY